MLDEAHEIKNPSSLTARAVFALKAERRWALTGSESVNDSNRGVQCSGWSVLRLDGLS